MMPKIQKGDLNVGNKRFYELDSLRGIAALVVVLYHYSTRYDVIYGHAKEDYLTTFGYGFFGVQLFFIISGFVIYMTILKVETVRDFGIKRAIRLYPAYIIAVILTFIVVSSYGLDRQVSWIDALLNLTMLQGFMPGVEVVDGVYWSLRVELTFYVGMAMLLALRVHKKVMLISIIWLLISSIIQIAYNIFDSHLFLLLESYTISNYSHLFIIGMVFFKLISQNKIQYHLIIITCLVYDLVFLGLENSLFTSLFVVLFYLLIYSKLSFLNTRPLVFLGAISYSLYLVHQNIGYVIINYMESIGLTHEIFLIVPIIISITLAYVITQFIEKPVQGLIYNAYKRVRSKRKIIAIKPKSIS